MTAEWHNTKPGTLALLGTEFRIVYEPEHTHTDGYVFMIYQGDKLRRGWSSLVMSKTDAERMYGELVEIGAVS